MPLRPLRKNRSYKVAKRLRKLHGIGTFSDTISYSQDIWQGKGFLPLMLTIRIGKKSHHKAYFSTSSPLFNQKHQVKIKWQ